MPQNITVFSEMIPLCVQMESTLG